MASERDIDLLLADHESEQHEEPPTRRPRYGVWAAVLLFGAVLAVLGWRHTGSTVALKRDSLVALDAEEFECFQGGAEELDLDLPAFDDKEVSVPTQPTSIEKYKYATDDALVSIPEKCYKEFKTQILKNTTLTDRDGTTGMAYLFISDLEGGYETLAKMSSCACGLVIEMHGSGGPGWTAVQLAALISRMGMIQVIPNSMAMPDDLELKGKLPLKDIGAIDTSNYCGGYSAFDGKCSKFSKPFCYSTKSANVLNDPTSYRKYVEGIYSIRKREMDYFVTSNEDLLGAFDKLYLVGNSEGAMSASRYHHEILDAKLSGRILSAWSCEFNYYLSCPKHAEICGDKCAKDIPQLNLIGDNDEYFGKVEKSVSFKVANAENGYGGPLTGNCRAQYDAQQFEKATVVLQEGAGHGPQYWDDNTWRSVIQDFLLHDGDDAGSWESLKACTLSDDKVYSCPQDGATFCKTIDGKYQVNPDVPYPTTTEFSCSASGS